MPDLWMPGATRLDIGDHQPTDGGPAKAVAHITWDRSANAAKPADLVPYTSLRSYFAGSGAGVAPHILWDPWTGSFTQFTPANSRSKSLVDQAGGTRTNRAGSVVIQIEALFFPYCRVGKTVYPRLVDTPCKGWPDIQNWVHSWGVPNVWPMGKPTDFTSHRNESVWEKTAGWYGHQQVPENNHQDPGSWPAFVGATPAKPTAKYEPFPGSAFFVPGRKDKRIEAMHHRLVAVGCNKYASSANADTWGSGDERSYAAWQRHLGYAGADADGKPGKTSWDRLQVPNV